jgi:hypothetical protein
VASVLVLLTVVLKAVLFNSLPEAESMPNGGREFIDSHHRLVSASSDDSTTEKLKKGELCSTSC